MVAIWTLSSVYNGDGDNFNFLDVYILVKIFRPFSRLLLRPLYNFFIMSEVVTLVLHMLDQYVSQLSSSRVSSQKKKKNYKVRPFKNKK